MTETSQTEEMKRFLFYEMSEKEREAIEDRFFEDSDYFYELSELENDLVDSYARGDLKGNDLIRFEKSLTKSPDRREQIKNARALQTLIAEEKPATAPVVVAPTLWERIAAFFTIKMSVMQYATGALAILLACTTGFLFYRNWQTRQEFARLQNEKQQEANEKNNLQEQIDRIQQERQDLAKQLEDSRGEKESIQAEYDKKQAQIEQLQRQRDNLPREKNIPQQNPQEIAPPKPFLAFSIIPTGRGGSDVSPTVRTIIRNGKQLARVTVPLPAGKDYGSYEITTPSEKLIKGAIVERAKSFTFDLSPEDKDFEIKVNERANTRGGSEILGTFRLEPKQRP